MQAILMGAFFLIVATSASAQRAVVPQVATPPVSIPPVRSAPIPSIPFTPAPSFERDRTIVVPPPAAAAAPELCTFKEECDDGCRIRMRASSCPDQCKVWTCERN